MKLTKSLLVIPVASLIFAVVVGSEACSSGSATLTFGTASGSVVDYTDWATGYAVPSSCSGDVYYSFVDDSLCPGATVYALCDDSGTYSGYDCTDPGSSWTSAGTSTYVPPGTDGGPTDGGPIDAGPGTDGGPGTEAGPGTDAGPEDAGTDSGSGGDSGAVDAGSGSGG